MYRIAKTWSFSAAHHLPRLPAGHPCSRVHGHNYTVTVVLKGDKLDRFQMLVDYRDLAPIGELVALLDHRDLNDVLKDTTVEHIAQWLYWRMVAEVRIPEDVWFESVRVSEGDSTWAEYAP